MNGYSHFAVKAECGGEVLDARVLNGDLPPPYMGEPLRGGPLHSGYGFGPTGWTMAGMPHFAEAEFLRRVSVREDDLFPTNVSRDRSRSPHSIRSSR